MLAVIFSELFEVRRLLSFVFCYFKVIEFPSLVLLICLKYFILEVLPIFYINFIKLDVFCLNILKFIISIHVKFRIAYLLEKFHRKARRLFEKQICHGPFLLLNIFGL